jgi:D-inositol-3-phosphate glycosyltransferase
VRIVLLSLHTSPAAQPGTGDAGGLNVYVSHTAAHLVRAGHAVDIITADPAAEHTAAVDLDEGVRLHILAVDATTKDEMGEEAGAIARRIAADPELGPLVSGADVVWAHYWVSGLVACDLRALAGTPAPPPGPDPAHHPALAMSFHTIAAVKDRDLGEAREPALRLDAELRIAREADLLVANTASEAADMRELLHADPARIRVVPPGVDTATFRPGPLQDARRAVGMESVDLLVLGVGRMQHVKGTDILLEALAQLATTEPVLAARTRVVMLGGASGEADATRLQERAAASAAGGLVEFRDPVPASVLADWYRAADLVVVPSRSESFGFVAAEAVASGTPVLASQVGGLAHIVRPGVSGVLVADRSPYTWAGAIAALLADPGLRSRLAVGATRMRDELSWETAEAGMLDVLTELAVTGTRGTTDSRGTTERSGA